jgi:hypothetical protein
MDFVEVMELNKTDQVDSAPTIRLRDVVAFKAVIKRSQYSQTLLVRQG